MSYRVNNKTLVVIPSGSKKCHVIENKKDYNLNLSTLKVIENSCEYFGVSYNSRVQGSQKFIKSKYKIPVIIEETSRLMFFPISSPTKSNSMWISYNNISEYYPSKNNKCTKIIFKNNYEMEADISFYSFNQQYLKSSKLNSVLVERIRGK